MTEWLANEPQVTTIGDATYTTFMSHMGTSETLPDGECYVLTVWQGDWRTAQDEPKVLSIGWLESGSCYGVDLETLIQEAITTA